MVLHDQHTPSTQAAEPALLPAVLDDNKKLCLVSGEIIQMSPSMTMMFEVGVGSPSTYPTCTIARRPLQRRELTS
jgi:hypothetical protein